MACYRLTIFRSVNGSIPRASQGTTYWHVDVKVRVQCRSPASTDVLSKGSHALKLEFFVRSLRTAGHPRRVPVGQDIAVPNLNLAAVFGAILPLADSVSERPLAAPLLTSKRQASHRLIPCQSDRD